MLDSQRWAPDFKWMVEAESRDATFEMQSFTQRANEGPVARDPMPLQLICIVKSSMFVYYGSGNVYDGIWMEVDLSSHA